MQADTVKLQNVKPFISNSCDYISSQSSTIESLLTNGAPESKCNLFLGGVQSLTSQVLSTNKIQSVLSIMTDKQKKKSKFDQKIEYLDDICRHNQMMCHQTTVLAPYFKSAIQFINDSFKYNMSVLVHCKQGDCKSAALVISYLIYKYKISFEKAYDIVRSKRNIVKLTESLQEQLREEETKLHEMK